MKSLQTNKGELSTIRAWQNGYVIVPLLLLVLLLISCGSDVTSVESLPDNGNGNDDDQIIEAEKPIKTHQNGNPGFFLDSWEPLQAVIPGFRNVSKPAGNASAYVFADIEDEITRISKYLFGNNANVYMGQMVTEPDLLNHIYALSPNILRFPGGNLSSIYFWNADPGHLPDDVPDMLIDGNTGNAEQAYYWYGNNTDSWTLSLDNYYAMLNQTDNTGMITVNYSYARYGTGPNPVQTAAQLAADWVRYDNGRTRYWEIGNENAGTWQAGYLIDTDLNQDGQPERITGALYGEHFNVFADSMRNAADEIGADIKIGAQLIHFDATNSWNPADRDWNEGYFFAAGDEADYYIVHDYYTPFEENSGPSVILDSATPVTHDIMEWMNTTFQMYGVETKPIAFTEWNIFATGSNQMVSDISGMHATMVVGEMIKNSYGMAARWNLANGWSNGDDHGMFNAGDEPGGVPKWNPRPDFFHLYYLQRIFGDTMIFSWEQGNSASYIQSYSSVYSSGHVAVVVANTDTNSIVAEINILNYNQGERYYWYIVEGGEGGNFSRQVVINGEEPEYVSGGPSHYQDIDALSASTEGGIKINVPGHSISYILIEPE